MKKNTINLLALTGLTLLAASPGTNGQSVGDDGTAASPRMRQILNERTASANAAASGAQFAWAKDAGYKVIGADGVAASPRMRQILNERPVAVGGTGGGLQVTSSGNVSYKAIGEDGVAA